MGNIEVQMAQHAFGNQTERLYEAQETDCGVSPADVSALGDGSRCGLGEQAPRVL